MGAGEAEGAIPREEDTRQGEPLAEDVGKLADRALEALRDGKPIRLERAEQETDEEWTRYICFPEGLPVSCGGATMTCANAARSTVPTSVPGSRLSMNLIAVYCCAVAGSQ